MRKVHCDRSIVCWAIRQALVSARGVVAGRPGLAFIGRASEPCSPPQSSAPVQFALLLIGAAHDVQCLALSLDAASRQARSSGHTETGARQSFCEEAAGRRQKGDSWRCSLAFYCQLTILGACTPQKFKKSRHESVCEQPSYNGTRHGG